MSEKKTVTYRLPPEVLAVLEWEAKEQRRNKNDIIVEAVKYWQRTR